MQPIVFRAVGVLAALLLLAAPAFAQLAARQVVSGIPNIVAFVQDPAIPNTFYLVQQSGAVRVLQDGDVLEPPFLDLTEISTAEERGLLGMAFAPDVSTGWVFVNYTNTSGATVIARFARSAGNPVQADVGSRLALEWPTGQRFIPQPAANHNGGHLAFGPDGFLYIGLGDGGGGNDQFHTAQNPGTLLGKMLRIDVNVLPDDPKGYRVPASNPFVPFIALGEIWDIGLRNPWRYSFDNVALGGTGALVIGDVGQGSREEVNYEPAGQGGRDYGWPIFEGMIATPGVSPPPPSAADGAAVRLPAEHRPGGHGWLRVSRLDVAGRLSWPVLRRGLGVRRHRVRRTRRESGDRRGDHDGCRGPHGRARWQCHRSGLDIRGGRVG